MISSSQFLSSVELDVDPAGRLVRGADCGHQFGTISRTLLRPQASWQPRELAPTAPDAAETALQQLITLIQTLRSPATDWTASTTLTPEQLLPYVSEEADDVLEALAHSPSPDPETTVLPAASLLWTIADLMPQILWGMARSAYPIMRLIEGVPGRCQASTGGWQAGMIRLVLLLEATMPLQGWRVDLATGRSQVDLLDPEQLLAFEDTLLFTNPDLERSQAASELPAIGVAPLLAALSQQVQVSTPTLQPLLTGLPVELLQPRLPWQTGQLRLTLGFEFVAQEFVVQAAATATTLPPALSNWSSETGFVVQAAAVSVPMVPFPQNALSPQSCIRLTDPAMLQPYTQDAIQPLLRHGIMQLRAEHEASHRLTPDQQQLRLVTLAAAIARQLQDWVLPGLGLRQPERLLDELAPKLLWQLTRSSYEIMRCLGGIEVQLLQPGQPWQPGTLRLVARLTLITPAQDWGIDLVTGQIATRQIATERSGLLQPASVIQSAAMLGYQQPMQTDSLLETLLQPLHPTELQRFLDGVAIEGLTSDHHWQSASLGLNLGWDWMPAPESPATYEPG